LMAERRNYQITVKSQNRLDGFPLEFLREVGMEVGIGGMVEGDVQVEGLWWRRWQGWRRWWWI